MHGQYNAFTFYICKKQADEDLEESGSQISGKKKHLHEWDRKEQALLQGVFK